MNIKNIKTYILSGILALSMSSCLDKYPEDSIRMDQAINTVDDMDKLRQFQEQRPLFGQSDYPARSAGRLRVLREGLL